MLGDIDADALGVTMSHEHLLVDQGQVTFHEPADPRDRAYADRPVTLDISGWLAWNWASNHDNLVLDDEAIAIAEAARFRVAGGRTLIDLTLDGIGRDPPALARIAGAAGLQVVMGAGYYVDPTHPPRVRTMSATSITDEIVGDVRLGVGGTGIRAGVIGEIGSSWPMTDEERKVLRAAGAAQRELGCGLSIHPGRHPDSPSEILDALAEDGADPTRVVMGHIERTVQRTDAIRALAERGCFIEYDLFGTEVTATFPYQANGIDMPSDAQRLDQIAELVEAGLGDRILVGQDVCTKHRTRHYGGVGYDHILRDIVPWMGRRGFDQATIDSLLVANPRRAFAMEEGTG